MRNFVRSTFAKAIASVCLATFSVSSIACTAINITAKDGTVIAGRTMEWAFEMDWTLFSMPRGTEIDLDAPKSMKLPATKMTSKYAFVAVAPGVLQGPPAFLEGQNSAGLGLSGNFLPGFTEYQTVTPQDTKYISILNFGRLILGMYGNVKELRAELPKYKVWFDPTEVKGLPTPPWLHLVLTDKTGDSIVVEFVKGQMRIHDNVANVLTNAPTYDWHISNVRNYLSLSNYAKASVTLNNQNVTEIGQGGGMMGLPGDYTPPSRFVRAAYLRHFSTQPQASNDGIQLMTHLLNTVDIPVGVAASKGDNQIVSDYTQWVNIKDLSNNRMLIADYSHRTNYLQIDLNQVFKEGKPKTWKISNLPYPGNDLTPFLLK